MPGLRCASVIVGVLSCVILVQKRAGCEDAWHRTQIEDRGFYWQGLGDMKTHMSRLEQDRAAAAAKKAAGVSSPAVKSRLPSYMRQTVASVAMQKARCASIQNLNAPYGPCHVPALHPTPASLCPVAGPKVWLTLNLRCLS